MIEDPDALVCVLVDEVESLAAAREKGADTEPSDAIRVVNALLTQIDKLKSCPNVLLLTTSNVTGSIDLVSKLNIRVYSLFSSIFLRLTWINELSSLQAFVDRADIKEYIGLPSAEAVYSMLVGSVSELATKGAIDAGEAFLVTRAGQLQQQSTLGTDESVALEPSRALLKVAEAAVGLSGRTIRKLPFLALATLDEMDADVNLGNFMVYLRQTVEKQLSDRKKLKTN